MFRQIVTDVFFDLDHTLWDFEKNSALTFEKILDENAIPIELTDFLKIYVPANLEFWKRFQENRITKEELRYQRLKTVFDRLKYPVTDGTINRLAEEYIAHLCTFTHLFPNTMEILKYLGPKYRLHIITNGFQEIQEKKMGNSGILDYFEVIVNSEMVGAKKPDPLIFEFALNRARTLPHKSIMIGDSLEADILGARSVGMHTLHFNAHNEPPHDHCQIIDDLNEIKRFL